jgi:hypothetical protein
MRGHHVFARKNSILTIPAIVLLAISTLSNGAHAKTTASSLDCMNIGKMAAFLALLIPSASPVFAETTPLEGTWVCNSGRTHHTIVVKGLTITSAFQDVINGKVNKDYGSQTGTLVFDKYGNLKPTYPKPSWNTEIYKISQKGKVTVRSGRNQQKRTCKKSG